MITPQTAYRCPLCSRYFPDMTAFSAHSRECEERHDPDASDMVGRILIRDDSEKEIVIPEYCSGGLAFCKSFKLEDFGDEVAVSTRDFDTEPYYIRSGAYRVADRETAERMMDSLLAEVRARFVSILDRVVV